MVDIKTAFESPYRRIYLVWGLVLIIGFILTGIGFGNGYQHWYPLSLIGLASQFIKTPLKAWHAKILLIMWGLVSLLGTLYTHLSFIATIPYPSFVPHIGFGWLALLSIPQMITGFILKKRWQVFLGFFWLLIALVFWTNWENYMPLDISFYFIGLATGLPYLYIAFKE